LTGFRWILLGLGLLLLLGIWWSGRRGSAQARGPALRPEPDLASGAYFESEPPAAPVHLNTMPTQREPSISPYEPLRVSSEDTAGEDGGLDIPVLSQAVEKIELVRLERLEHSEHSEHLGHPELLERTAPGRSAQPQRLSEHVEYSEPALSQPELAPPRDADASATQFLGLEDTDEAVIDTDTTHELRVENSASITTPAAALGSREAWHGVERAASDPSGSAVSVSAPAFSESAPAQTRAAVSEAHLASGRFARREPRAAQRTDTSGRFARVKTDPPKPIELQKIVTVRVVALAEEGWAGEDVAAALVGSDFVHGRYGVFHRLHPDGRTLFYVASLVEPGSFDPALMPEQTFPGLSIFAVLPGPLSPLDTLEELLGSARQLAIDLAGTIQDEQGGPLTPHKAGLLREELRTFQRRLQEASAT